MKLLQPGQVKVNQWLACNSYNFLTSDSWSNIRNEVVINYMLVSANMLLLVDPNPTGKEGHTSTFMVSDNSWAINPTQGKLDGAVMDNMSGNKAKWELLKYEHS